MLINQQGNETNRLAKVGDYFQINIPGPGPAAGAGYDWVEVEAIEDHANPDDEDNAACTLPDVTLSAAAMVFFSYYE